MNFHVSDVGAVRELAVKEKGEILDVSGGTAMQITVFRPNATSFTRTATFVGTGSDGKVQWVTESGDLTVEGVYHDQLLLTLGAWTGSADRGSFSVYAIA